jgi:hypothetical protein
VNENNSVIDVHRKGDAHATHRYITGTLIYSSKDNSTIRLVTPEGERDFPVERGRSRLSLIEEGLPITVEVNEAGKVIDIHRMTVELALNEAPVTTPGHHITMEGVVTEIQSGVVFVKTTAARYTISEKTVPADLKVGDELTLWVNQNNTIVDHHRKGHAAAHRWITGKLIYTGKTKSEIKLWTPEGEQVFPLERLEIKTKPIEEGATVTVELNEESAVIALRKVEA